MKKSLILLAVVAVLAGCSTAMVTWEAAAYEQAKAVADNHVRVTTAMICATPIDAALRMNFIPVAQVACQPSGSVGLNELAAGRQPINITVQMPGAAASAAK